MKTTEYLYNLTPLRGIAALLTVIFHVGLIVGSFGGTLLNEDDSYFLSHMYLMVDFFFVLSGFILCHVYAKNFENAVTGTGFKNFTVARFARIYPLHLFSLVLTTLFLFLLGQWGAKVSPIIDTENSVYSFFTNFFLLQSMNLHEWFSFTHASWSISTEWWMYMLFPFLVGPFLKLSKLGRTAIFALCVGGYFIIGFMLVQLVTVPDSLSFFRLDTPPPFNLNVSYQYGFFRCLFGFVIGMMVYLGYQDQWAKKFFASGYTFSILAVGLGLCLHFGTLDVLTALFFPFILLSAVYGSPGLNALLTTKPLQKLGEWSFSIYLMHQPFLFQGAVILGNPDKSGIPVPQLNMLTSWVACLAFVFFTLVISYLTYRFIEVPARNWINTQWGKKSITVLLTPAI